MSGIVKLKVVSGTTVKLKVSHNANSLISKSGQTALASGASSATVTFTTTRSDASYLINAWITNETDANPAYFPVVRVSSRTAAGFTVTWDIATDTANYLLNWHSVDISDP